MVPFFNAVKHFLSQSYLWQNNETVAKWIETDLGKEDESVIRKNVKWIKRDAVLKKIKV